MFANLNAYPSFAPLLKKKSLIVKSSIVTSPFNRNASLLLVPAVGEIFTLLRLCPFTVTPTGTVSGNTSE